MPTEPSLFPHLFDGQPEVVRGFLEATLRLRSLQQLYGQARLEVSERRTLSQAVLSHLNVGLVISPGDRARIPASGAVLVVANHPFGILDGMLLDSLLMSIRPDVKVLTNSMLASLQELQGRVLPVDLFGEGRHNIRTLRRVLQLLQSGQGAAFFPAGEVSHFQPTQRRVSDGIWSTAVVRCALATDTPVVPVYFQGGNSWSFQMAGLLHPRLRTAQLASELFNKRGRQVEVRVGCPIPVSELRRFPTLETATEYLRARTYYLAYRGQTGTSAPLLKPSPAYSLKQPVAPPGHPETVTREIEKLRPVVETADFQVVVSGAAAIPSVLNEIGRLREETFRKVGEGSGQSRDLDRFDRKYHQVVLWDKGRKQIAGGYRLAWTEDLLAASGVSGLYTSTLFRFAPQFFGTLGPAVELGRSFVCPDYQKDYQPLLLLWQGIAKTVASRPEAPILFGPVSISSDYGEAARALIVRFITQHSFRDDLAALIEPRHAFRSRLTSSSDLNIISRCLDDVEDLGAPLEDLSGQGGVPVLLRQYLRLGGRVAGFNVDRKFGNALDGLLIVDLRTTAPKLLNRYMGSAQAAEFLKQTRPRTGSTAA